MNTLADVRRRLAEVNPVFAAPDAVAKPSWANFGRAGAIDASPFEPAIGNFYLTNPICRASVTMAQCVEAFSGEIGMKTGTYG